MRRATDAIHLGLMFAALGITYLVPFELLLLSYVVLGPAHYFTEISWLHDRKYFLPHRSVPHCAGNRRRHRRADRQRIVVRVCDVDGVRGVRCLPPQPPPCKAPRW